MKSETHGNVDVMLYTFEILFLPYLKQVRSLAANSQRMREELRRKYGKDSFDKVALETELQARIGRGHTSATKNKSTVLLA